MPPDEDERPDKMLVIRQINEGLRLQAIEFNEIIDQKIGEAVNRLEAFMVSDIEGSVRNLSD